MLSVDDLTREELSRLYLEEGLTEGEIARRYGTYQVKVSRLRRSWGIPTVRHNRARGKHQVVKMSDIVLDLTRRGWKAERIAQELGMEPDEVLRLKQVTGLAELFKDRAFSAAWDIVEEE